MKVEVNQVGKRWFLCTDSKIDVEATYTKGTNIVHNPSRSINAGYDVYDWVPTKRWVLTGKGAKKHRSQIISAIETHLREYGLPQEIAANE